MDTSKGAALQVVKDGKVIDSLPLSKLLRSKGGSVTVGRGLNSDIRVDHASCSRLHAAILWKEGSLFIKDLTSTHGTTLHNTDSVIQVKRDTAEMLHNGAVVVLGASTRQFRFKDLDRLAAEMEDASDPAPESLARQLSQLGVGIEASVGQRGKENAGCSSACASTRPVSASVSLDSTAHMQQAGQSCPVSPCADSSAAKDIVSAVAKSMSWLLILDTNVFMDVPSYVKLARLVALRRPDLVRAVVPRIVIRELDKLNHGVNIGKRQQIRTAFKLFEDEQGKDLSIIHLQAHNEPNLDDTEFFRRHAREHHYHQNDDYIAEAAHFFAEQAANASTSAKEEHLVVLTNDRALRVRMRSEGLQANAAVEFLPYLVRHCELQSHGLQKSSNRATSGVSAPCRMNR